MGNRIYLQIVLMFWYCNLYCRYCKDDRAPFNPAQSGPGCSMLFNGTFYDNISLRRKGQSSLNWPKAKFKVDGNSQGKIFDVVPGGKKVKQVNFNSGKN